MRRTITPFPPAAPVTSTVVKSTTAKRALPAEQEAEEEEAIAKRKRGEISLLNEYASKQNKYAARIGADAADRNMIWPASIVQVRLKHGGAVEFDVNLNRPLTEKVYGPFSWTFSIGGK